MGRRQIPWLLRSSWPILLTILSKSISPFRQGSVVTNQVDSWRAYKKAMIRLHLAWQASGDNQRILYRMGNVAGIRCATQSIREQHEIPRIPTNRYWEFHSYLLLVILKLSISITGTFPVYSHIGLHFTTRHRAPKVRHDNGHQSKYPYVHIAETGPGDHGMLRTPRTHHSAWPQSWLMAQDHLSNAYKQAAHFQLSFFFVGPDFASTFEGFFKVLV